MSVCLCGSLSVNDLPLCASHPSFFFFFAIPAVCSHFACAVHPLLPTILPLAQTPGEACVSIICHWVMNGCTFMGIGPFQKQRYPLYIRVFLCLFMNMSRIGGILATRACGEGKQRRLLRLCLPNRARKSEMIISRSDSAPNLCLNPSSKQRRLERSFASNAPGSLTFMN